MGESHTASFRLSPRRVFRVLAGVIAGVCCLGAIAYASVPLWFPADWLAARVARDLSGQLGVPVSIGSLRLGWARGVEIRGLIIAGGPRGTQHPLVRVEQIGLALEPLRLLLTHSSRQLRINDVDVWLEVDADGQILNLPTLPARSRGGLAFLQYSVKDVLCHVQAPAGLQTVRLDRVDCQIDPASGVLSLQAGAVNLHATDLRTARPPGVFLVDADVTLARLRPDKRLGGVVRIDWKNLALSDLPLALVPHFPVRQGDGVISGKLTVHPHADLSLDGDLQLDLDGVTLMRDPGGASGRPIDARLEAAGRWDPAADELQLTELSYQTNAIHLHRAGQGAALSVDRGGPDPLRVNLAGRVKDWGALENELPEVATFLRSVNAELQGGAGFELELTQGLHEEKLVVRVDARETACLVRGPRQPYLIAPFGVQKTLLVDAVRPRDAQRLFQPRIQMTLGELSLGLQSELPVLTSHDAEPVRWAERALAELTWQFSATAGDLRQVIDYLPGLADLIRLDEADGPLRVAALFEHRDERSELRVNLQTSDRTTLSAGDWLRIRPNEPLEILTRISFPHVGGEAELRLRGAVGDLEIAIPAAPLSYRFTHTATGAMERAWPQADDVSIDATLQIPVQLAHVEKLADICPKWSELLGPVTPSGDLSLEGRIQLTHRPHELMLLSRLQLLADDLELRHEGRLRKSRGQPVRLDVEHRLAVSREGREQTGHAELRLKPLRITADLAFAGLESQDLSDDFEQVRVAIDIDDAATAFAAVPELAQQVEQVQVHGQCRLELENLLIGSEQRLDLRIEATHMDLFVDGEQPFHKRSGVPALCELAWTGRPDPASPALQNWELRQGRVELGGLRTTTLAGHVVTSSDHPGGSGFIPVVRTAGINRSARPARSESVFRSASLKSAGSLRFDRSLGEMSDLIRRLFDEYHLTGECTYGLELAASPEKINVNGTVGAEKAAFSLNLDQPHIPMFRKAAGTPAEAAFHAGAVRERGGGFVVQLHDADLTLPGVNASVDGVFVLDPLAEQLSVADVDVIARVHVLDPKTIGALLPASDVRLGSGACLASVHVMGTRHNTRLEAAHLDLNKVQIRTPADPLQLDGVLTADRDRVTIDQLKVKWGGLDAVLSGDVRLLDHAAGGRIAVTVDRLDLSDFQRRLGVVTEEFGDATRQNDETQTLQSLFDFLRSSNLTMSGDAQTVIFQLPLEVAVSVDAVSMRAAVHRGEVDLTFHCLVDGGQVSGSCKTDLRDPLAPFHLSYRADRIQPGRLVDRYLSLTFPGMKATGPLTLIDETYQKFLPRSGELNHPVGRGEMMIAGGTIEGRSAPEWMGKIFPGLNLSSFEFSYMHSWFTKTVDGRVRHQMIYQGRYYNIYAVGSGDAEGRIDYEVGLDFLADFDSQYWAESGQGRIPLFRKTGIKAADGSLQNEVVTYTPPERILDTLLVKNNPLVTAYHAVRKRVRREQ